MIESSEIINGVDIAYQLYGDETKPTVLLIHGLSTPLTGWPPEFVTALVKQGYQVLLLDNRDMGRSRLLTNPKLPNFVWTAIKFKFGLSPKVPYSLEDMMMDTLLLLDHLNINKVHLVGASMGGMIAQLLAIHHPTRVQTLTSIMSTTGNKKLPPMSKTVTKKLAKRPASSLYKDRLAYHINKWQAIGSPQYPASKEYLTVYTSSLLERGITTIGTIRQILAILAASNREPLLNSINIPSLILHGECDELVHVDAGKATAKSIPNAQLKIYPGMGHDFPRELIAEIVQDILQFIELHTDTDKAKKNIESDYEPA
jgi:pimeloyl-ACP methyl ester carboxylesterase